VPITDMREVSLKRLRDLFKKTLLSVN